MPRGGSDSAHACYQLGHDGDDLISKTRNQRSELGKYQTLDSRNNHAAVLLASDCMRVRIATGGSLLRNLQKYSRTSQTRNAKRGGWHTTAPKSEDPKAPLVLPTLGHRRPVCVSSLEKLYAEPLRVAQVLSGPLTQGSLIFLEVGHTISTCNIPEYVSEITLL